MSKKKKIGSGHTRAHEPDGDSYAGGSISIHHGLCILESWQTSRTSCVSNLVLLNPHHACMHDFFFFFLGLVVVVCVIKLVSGLICIFGRTPLEECVRFVTNYKLTKEDIDYIKNNLSVSCEVHCVLIFISWCTLVRSFYSQISSIAH